MKKLLLALTLSLAIGLSACSTPKDETPPHGEGIPSVVDAQKRDRPDFEQLEKAMNKDVASIVAPESLELVGGADEFRKAIVEGTTFKVQEDTWTPDEGVGGVVIEEHTPSGIVIENFTLLLQDENQDWWISATMSVEQAVDAGIYEEPVDKADKKK